MVYIQYLNVKYHMFVFTETFPQSYILSFIRSTRQIKILFPYYVLLMKMNVLVLVLLDNLNVRGFSIWIMLKLL